MAPCYIVILANLHRKAAQGHVSIGATVQPAVLSKTPVIPREFALNLARLVELWPAVLYVENFLECHYVGVKFGDHGCDAVRTGAPVEPPAFMDVVSGDPQTHRRALLLPLEDHSHSLIQPLQP